MLGTFAMLERKIHKGAWACWVASAGFVPQDIIAPLEQSRTLRTPAHLERSTLSLVRRMSLRACGVHQGGTVVGGATAPLRRNALPAITVPPDVPMLNVVTCRATEIVRSQHRMI